MLVSSTPGNTLPTLDTNLPEFKPGPALSVVTRYCLLRGSNPRLAYAKGDSGVSDKFEWNQRMLHDVVKCSRIFIQVAPVGRRCIQTRMVG